MAHLRLSGIVKKFPCRYVLAIMMFFGLLNVYAMRVNLSVAILAMVKQGDTSSGNNVTYSSSGSCPAANATLQQEDDDNTRGGDIDWTLTQKGNILGAFFYGYVVMNLIGGRLTEVLGSKWMYGIGLLLTSILTLVSPFVAQWNYYAFLTLRVLIGLFEGVSFPAFHCILGRWIPLRERGLIYMCIQSGASMGQIIGELLSGVLCESTFLGGWPSSFYVFGICGVIWSIFWFALMYEYPKDHPRMSPKEKYYIVTEFNQEGHAQKNIPLPWKAMLKSVPLWAAVIILFGNNWIVSFDVLEWPTFMNKVLQYNLQETGILSSIPDLVSLFVSILVSAVGDWILRKGYLTVTGTRKLLTFLGTVPYIPYTFAIVYLRCNGKLITIFRILYSVGSSLSAPGYIVSMIDMAPTFAGTIMGLSNGLTQTTGIIVPVFTSFIVKQEDSLYQWHIVFYTNMIIFTVTVVIFLIFGTAAVQPWSKVPETKEESNKPDEVELPTAYNIPSS